MTPQPSPQPPACAAVPVSVPCSMLAVGAVPPCLCKAVDLHLHTGFWFLLLLSHATCMHQGKCISEGCFNQLISHKLWKLPSWCCLWHFPVCLHVLEVGVFVYCTFLPTQPTTCPVDCGSPSFFTPSFLASRSHQEALLPVCWQRYFCLNLPQSYFLEST